MRWIVAMVVFSAPALARAEATASFTASRVEGVAPLAVYFDAGASTCEGCAGVVDPWHDLMYSWDFGDPDAGTWAASGRSKGRDVGPSAAHVFERPGHYVVTLSVTDPISGETAVTTRELDVADPDQVFAGAGTICYRASERGDFAGCPAGAQQRTMVSFNAAYGDCAAADRRCLLRGGDTFIADGPVYLDANAPPILGAFGPGPRPTVDAKGLGVGWLFQCAAGGDDWRVMDLRVVGPGVVGSIVFFGRKPQRDGLILRLEAEPDTWHNFVLMDATSITGDKNWHERMFVVESSVPKAGYGGGGSGGNIMYVAWKDSAVLGNEFRDTRTGEHIFRAEAYDGLLLAHNRLGPAAFSKTAITLRSVDQKAPCAGSICGPSRRGVILANEIAVNPGWTVQACGVAMNQVNHCEDTLVDGNFAFAHPDFPLSKEQVLVFNLADSQAISYRTSFRNNICDLTGVAPWCADLKVGTLARALNNTCYRGDGDLQCVRTDGATPDGVSTVARNNLAFGSGNVVAAFGDWAEIDHNMSATRSPFVAAEPGPDPLDFRLADGSPAIDAGVAVANARDFAGRRRPAGAAFDVGAWEYGALDDPLETTGGDETGTTGEPATSSGTSGTSDVTTGEPGGTSGDVPTGGEVTGGDTSGTGVAESTSPDATDGSAGTDGAASEGGCGCSAAPASDAGWFAGILLPAVRRRRRAPR